MDTLGNQPILLGGFYSAVEDEFLPGNFSCPRWSFDHFKSLKLLELPGAMRPSVLVPHFPQ